MPIHLRPRWRNAARLFAGAVSLAGAYTAALAQPSDPSASGQVQKLEAFEVTGSRIKRIDVETPQPVVRLTSEEFKATGFSTVGDAVRAMPAVSGASLVSIDGGTSFTPGVSSFNLRGLGNNNTLVLINGRRAAPYGTAGFNGFQTVFDLNSIPVAAIESIEVLKDGASAIYGSDAVAGVVNVTLKKNYNGLTTELTMGNTFSTDSFEKSFFAVGGTSSGKMSMIATLDWRERSSIYGRDLSYTDESDGRPYGGVNQASSRAPIANVVGLADRTRFPQGTATFATPQSSPTLAAAVPGNTTWNFQEEAGFTPDERQFGFYTRMLYDFTPQLHGFAELAFRRSEIRIDSASTPVATTSENGTSPAGKLMLPRTNPYNPFGQDILDLRWRITEAGARIQDVTTDTPRITVGLGGSLPFRNWQWEVASLYTKAVTENAQRNYVQDSLLQNAFNGVLIDGRTRYANPFGPNDPLVLDYIKVSNPTQDTFEIRSTDFSASGSLFEIPSLGMVSLALGGEQRSEYLENMRTGLNRTGQLVGGGEGSGTSGSRRVHAFYAELSLPLGKHVELQFAGRHENYSDFGDATKPKVALVVRPVPEVMLRGSFGQSFLAPNLPYLYTAQSTSFSSNSLADPLRPNDPRQQIKQLGGGNPSLNPEDTDVTYAGIVLQPFARQKSSIFKELSFGADFYLFDQKNLIDRPTAQDILDDLGQYGHLVRRNPPGPGETVGTIDAIVVTWQNLNTARWRGYDFNMRWVFPKTSIGQFRTELSATYIDTYIQNGTEYAGEYNYPRTRGNFTLAWKNGDWAASLYANYLSRYTDDFEIAEVGEQWVVNPQVSYSGWRGYRFTVGVRNVLNSAPPLDRSDSKLVNENVNYVEPSFWYFRVSKDW